jgi:glutamate dehydrogenase (NAD(P)+)
MLHERGILIVPDFIANAGGVICAAMEYRGTTQTQAFQAIHDKITTNTREVLAQMQARACLPREAAVGIAAARVRGAMACRRFGIM